MSKTIDAYQAGIRAGIKAASHKLANDLGVEPEQLDKELLEKIVQFLEEEKAEHAAQGDEQQAHPGGIPEIPQQGQEGGHSPEDMALIEQLMAQKEGMLKRAFFRGGAGERK